MKEYIDRNVAEQAKPEFLNEKVEDYEKAIYAKGWNDCNAQYRENILSIPTSDVVEVVRCQECKHGEYDDAIEDEYCYHCRYDGFSYNKADHFCSDGERKGGDE